MFNGKFLRSVGNVTADAISTTIRILRGNRSKVSIVQTKEIRATKTRRFLDSIKPGVRACGPKHTPSFRVGWPHAV